MLSSYTLKFPRTTVSQWPRHETTWCNQSCNTPNLVDLTGDLSWRELHRSDIKKPLFPGKTKSSTICLSNWLVATYNGFKEGLNWMNWRFLFGDQTSIIFPFDPYQRSLSTLRLLFSMLSDLILTPHPNALGFFSNYHDPQRVWATKHLGFPGTSAATNIKHMDENWMVKLLNYRWVSMLLNLCHRNHHPFLSYPNWRICLIFYLR